MGKWKKVEEHKPTDFVSVLGHMTDAGEFPSVRECYLIDGQHFFFPALGEIHPVDKWKEMPPAVDISADMVKVVLCKECKHLMFSDCYGECKIGHIGIVQPDDFCSYGERRADHE